ncbi:MAG: alpha/beta hydrolase [Kineosporiaceae bacterium]
MTAIVLVHGAWSDARVWSGVCRHLQSHGHRVVAPDLPAHGDDPTPPGEATLDLYAQTVRRTLQELDAPAVLVGHSMAGTVISTVAEQHPELVSHLVYLAAFLLPDGQSLYSFTQTSPGMAASALGPALRPQDGTLGIDPDAFIDVFCHDAPAALAQAARARLKPDPLRPLGSPVVVTAQRWGATPRSYIHTGGDRCVSPASQREMVDAVGVNAVATVEGSHLAMLSCPAEVAAAIATLAG